jgi:hypothetical protein
MPLNTYANLKIALQQWTGRNEIDANGTADDAIDLFEAEANRTLRHRLMLVKTSALTLGVDGLVHPADWLEWETISNGKSPYRIETVSDHSLANILESNAIGSPVYAIVRGAATQLIPAPLNASDITAWYYGKIPALGGGTPTNWLLDKHPDLYLYGSLLAVSSFARDAQESEKWERAYRSIFSSITEEGDASEFGGSTLQIRNAR